MIKKKVPVITVTDMDDTNYVLLTDEDIEVMCESDTEPTENGVLDKIMCILSRPWVPVLELDGARILLNSRHVKKVEIRTAMKVTIDMGEEGEEEED